MSMAKSFNDVGDVASHSLQERAAAALREEIIHGRLRPGERLSELELSQQFNTSRSPVREALVQLAQEGFVETAVHRHDVASGFREAAGDEEEVGLRLVRWGDG